MGQGPQVRGNFKMNIPIQPYANVNSDWRIPRHNKIVSNGQNCSETGLPIYFNSFTFTPDNSMYQSYKNKNIKYYSAMNVGVNSNGNIDPNVGNNIYNQNVKSENQAVRTPDGNESWSQMQRSDWKFSYLKDEVVEGGSLILSKDATNPEEGDWSYASPVYYKMNPNLDLNMLNSQKIVIRTDRLPTSDNTYKRFSLHQNKRFAIYTIADSGEVTGISTGVESLGGEGDDFNEDAGAIVTQINETFSCEKMVPLECYKGSGYSIGVQPSDDRCYYVDNAKTVKKMYGGCYYLITKNFAIGEDFQSIAEWKARFRMMYALCNNVVSLSFVNNWINGSLYMFAFQKDDIYSNNINSSKFLTNPEYQYCEDTIVYQTQNNSFFYRATPYNNGFIGRDNEPQDNILGQSNAANRKFLGNPTTIMDLGPRDEFIKELCYNPEFQGYIVDTVKTSSYNDTSDIMQLFAISRLTSSGFWNQILGLGDASIARLFSRDNSRLDGDIAQLISINSEYGVIPYLGSNYTDDDVLYYEVNGDPTLGVFFQANTVNRDMITPGRFTFQDINGSFLYDYYGHNDQEVPFYKWGLYGGPTTIFGTDVNDWVTKGSSVGVDGGIGSINYQSIDRMLSGPEFNSEGNSPSTRRPGFIYNSEIVGNEIQPKISMTSRPTEFMLGSPYFFYFGLRKGGSSMNRFIDKFVLNQDTL